MKIAIIQTHPIQHFCPQFASYARLDNIEIKVFFETDKGMKPYFDKQFNKEIKWEGIDLNSFPHVFLNSNPIEIGLEKYRPDVLIVYGYTKKIQMKATVWGKANKLPLLYISDTENHQKRPFLKQLIKKRVLRKKFKNYNGFLSVGDANEDFYKWCHVKKQRIIRMFFPIDIKHLDRIKTSRDEYVNQFKDEFRIKKDTLIISNVGKLVSWKSQSDLIDAVFELEKKEIPCVALLIGSGEDMGILKEQAKKLKKNKIMFIGFVQPEEMMRYLSVTDIYLHPAKIEPHSLAISEAIYLGCPVILSDSCGSYGPTDDVQPGKNGFVYPTGDILSLVEKIAYLYKNPEVREAFSKASIEISKHNQKLAHGNALKAAINLIQTN
jgi:glycosyltransferase involved in cell wall biosynthesis